MATVKYYLKRPKDKNKELKKTPVSINLKFSLDRDNRFELATGEQIPPVSWMFNKQQAKPSYRGAVELNLTLTRISTDIIQLWRDNKTLPLSDLSEMAANLIKFGQVTAPVEKKSLHDVLKLFIEQYGREKDEKTVKKYEALQTKLQLFKLEGLFVEDLDMTFYDKFKQFLYDCPNPKYVNYSLHLHSSGDYWEILPDTLGDPVGLLDATVMKYIVNLKTVLEWADKRDYPVHPSYKKWEIINRKYKPISLTRTEVEKLENANITPEAVLETLEVEDPKSTQAKRSAIRLADSLCVGRDYLAVECRIGQRISDIKRFDLKDYFEYKWTFYPRKGNRLSEKQVTVYFQGYCAPALYILAHHNFQMPKISEQKLNRAIKRVCKFVGIDQEISVFRWKQNKKIKITGPKYELISTHTGRKTFITIALQYMPPKVVMDLTGIESFETLNHYMDDSDEVNVVNYLTNIQDKPLMKKAQ
jgi:integrase